MYWESEEINPREEEILTAIRQYISDARCDFYNDGYDEGYKEGESHAWDEARNKGYDEGWEDLCQYLLDKYLERNGFIKTPDNIEEIHKMVENQFPAVIIIGAVINYLHAKVTDLKVNKND